MECMKTYAKQSLSYGAHVRCICPEDVIAHACQLVNFDLSKVTVQEVTDIQRNFELTCFGSSVLHGFVLWFTVSFPENVTLSTSPYSQSTHWGQTLFYNEEECDVRQDTQIQGTITMKPNKAKPRFLDVNIGFQIDKHNIQQKSYYMSDNITWWLLILYVSIRYKNTFIVDNNTSSFWQTMACFDSMYQFYTNNALYIKNYTFHWLTLRKSYLF